MNISQFFQRRSFLLFAISFAIVCTLVASPLSSQTKKKFWIEFVDKGNFERNSSLQKSNLSSLAQSINIDTRAIERRRKVLPPDSLISVADFPIAEEYIQRIERLSVNIVSSSRWRNAVSALLDSSEVEAIRALPFVAKIYPVVRWKYVNKEGQLPFLKTIRTSSTKAQYGLQYGESLNQVEMIDVPKVHDIWVDGTGVLVGMNDNGFRWRVHEAMKNMKIIREFDFMFRDSLTENDSKDTPGQDGHGTLTLSTLGGFKEGVLVGPAFNASFELAKTEVNSSETQIEEDYWQEGVEWHERNGADVVSSSLGYNSFDSGRSYSYSNGDFNGRTAVTSIAAARAARMGVVVVNSMGNEGNILGSIIAPADADSIISAGAVRSDSGLAGFSSIGPTNDGRIKPDVCALGVQVFCATRDDTASYTRASGTSLSCPLISGVSSLVLSARAELTPLQVREAIRNTASQATAPDNRKGWGIVNAWDAVLYYGMVISSNPKIFWNGSENTVAAYVVSKKTNIDPSSVTLYYTQGTGNYIPVKMNFLRAYSGLTSGSGLYTAVIPKLPLGQTIRYYIAGADTKENRTMPYNAPNNFYTLRIGETNTIGAKELMPSAFALDQNYPNPVSSMTAFRTQIKYSLPSELPMKLELYDRLGRRMSVLKEGIDGSNSVQFTASDLASGVYFYRLIAGGNVATRKLIVLR